jgi:hypothetical protein
MVVAHRRAGSGLIACLLATQMAGCAKDPCDQDPLGCDKGDEFVAAPSCELSGPLEVVLGQGTDEFTPFDPDQEPRVHEGVQGGHHLCLGFRVDNPALEYPQLAISMVAELNDTDRCADGDADCDPWVSTGTRDFVLGPELPLGDQDSVELTGLILIISLWPTELERRVRLDILDPCGREGVVEHVIPPAL